MPASPSPSSPKKLNPAQQNYSTYERELLAIYEAVKHFHHMLEARHFIIFTDYNPITYTFQQNWDKCSPQQFNHLDFFAQFMTGKGTFLDGITLLLTPALTSNLSLHYHPTMHWPHRKTGTTSSEHSWVNHCPAAREIANPWYRILHLLRHVCWEILTIHSSSLTAPSVPVHP
jgi:hypothetical protein